MDKKSNPSHNDALSINLQKFDRKTLAKMTRELRNSMKMVKSVIRKMRSEARY